MWFHNESHLVLSLAQQSSGVSKHSWCIDEMLVILQTNGQDKYGRALADVILRMERTSTICSSMTAGASGIESMRQQVRCQRAWGGRRERRKEVCRLIHSSCRHGLGASDCRRARPYAMTASDCRGMPMS